MSARLFACISLFGLCVVPGAASADGLVIPGVGPADPGRPAYREARFPPPQHNILGLPVPPPSPYDRPSYRQTYNAFPPPGGRFGGGFIEYIMTGGRPEPVAPQPYAAAAAPGSFGGTVLYAPPAVAALPRSGLPDYASVPPAAYGNQATYASPGATYDPVAADPGIVTRPMNPIYYRQEVTYSGHQRPGTIIIDTPEKFLFLIEEGGRALRYGIGVGRPGFAWAGVKTISRKAEWPDWTPPAEMLARRPDLPRHMAGGEANPLGARALYLGSSLYRIHGTNEPYTIGTNVSSGCIRMMNQDVEDLYGRVGIGTRVVVL